MPVARLPLTFPIESRTASTAKDSRLVNAMVEGEDIVKRPGLVDTGWSVGSGQAQGIMSWNHYNIVINANTIYSVNSTDTVATLGSLVGTQVPCSFVETGNDRWLVFHNQSNLYLIDKVTNAVTAPLSGSTVLSANINNAGGWYSSVPSVTFSGSAGTNATGTAIVSDHRVSGITINTPGSGHTTVPTVTIAAPSPSGTTATAKVYWTRVTQQMGFLRVQDWYYIPHSTTILNGGTLYSAVPTVTYPTYTSGGVGQASGHTTISGGVVNAVITDQSGGYFDDLTTVSSYPVYPTITSGYTVNWTNHGLSNGSHIIIIKTTGATLPTGIVGGEPTDYLFGSSAVDYWVVGASTHAFSLAASPGGAAISGTGASTGNLGFYAVAPSNLTISAPVMTTATATAIMDTTITGPWVPGIVYLDGYVYLVQKTSTLANIVSITIATPGVFTWTSHSLSVGCPITFTTTGALPTGLTAGTQYYVISTGLTADTFQVSTTVGGTAVNTSGTQSGTHTATASPSATARIYGSNKEDPRSWSALNYISANSDPDGAIGCAKHLNYLVVFGQWSTEFFYNAGNPSPGSPLGVNTSAKLEIGCANGNSIAKVEQSVLWIGQSLTQGRSVYMLQGLSPVKVSTRYIDKYLNAAPLATSTQVRSYCLKTSGHTLYILTLGAIGYTFIYDLDEKKWYQWTSQSGDTTGTDGTETYFLPTFFSGNVEYSPNLYLQAETGGKVYTLSTNTYKDGTNKIYFRAVSSILDSGSTKRKVYKRVEVVGDKVYGTLKIRRSDDDYLTWSTYRNVILSDKRPVLYQYGEARRRAWEVFSSSDIPIRLKALEIDFAINEQGGGQEE